MKNNRDEQITEKRTKGIKINYHFILLGLIVFIFVFAAIKLLVWNFGSNVNENFDTEIIDTDVESMDNIIPLNSEFRADYQGDGITTIACFGNSPFLQEMGKEDNIPERVSRLCDATVLNFAAPSTYLSAKNETYLNDYPLDAFSFYWMTTAFCVDNYALLEQAADFMGEEKETYLDICNRLQETDFNQVDVIAIMYDASDYYDVRPTYNSDNSTSIQHFCGALEAGIDLIQKTYPHIRIIVMSPTYAYAVDEEGNYLDSDITDYGMGPLSTYVITQSNSAYARLVTFVDNLYGSIHADNAEMFLEDNIHLNKKGLSLIAGRLANAINKYPLN